ncbi:MAG TPA: TetR/AcrR family transcriptional regulator [Candidatus Dormibacteraeota bacterium]|nr:TetR/AcrR family transcriptional regulator [Candidatus Dormibacteraeota bacterium]
MSVREYRLGRRAPEIERTRARILAAARRLVAELGPETGVGKVAELAGVSRITVYNQFGSKARLLEALSAELGPSSRGVPAETAADPAVELRRRIEQACRAWAEDPVLYRRLLGHRGDAEQPESDHGLAERLARQDRLRPGCSIREAEDVIGILTSFPVFDRLHKGGRRSPSTAAEILLRMTSGFMKPSGSV